MADRPTGFQKTARLDTSPSKQTQPSGDSGATSPTPSPDTSATGPAASASSIEMVLSDDIGRTIAGRYRITDVIGEGGMGVVYEAWDAQVERKVAIKLVRAESTTDRKFLSRFRRELEITSQLRHPSTIRVFEHGQTDDGRPYMVMELLTGESLADRLERGSMPEMEALQIARQVAESLSEAHEHGVFHRDLKPDNIFIETVGVSKVVKVLDFGIAGGVDATRLTQAGEVFGTPQYMSPEQCNGLPLDHRTDIYSLGCILYEMIEGRPPFSAETPMATMLKHVRAKVPAPRRAGPETARVMLMALRKDRAKRIQTAGRFAELIGHCIGHLRAIKEGRAPDSSKVIPVSSGNTGSTPVMPASAGMPVAPRRLSGGPGAVDRKGLFVALGLGSLALVLVLAIVFGGFGDGQGRTETAPSPTPAPSVAGGSTSKSYPFNRALVQTNVTGASVLVDGAEQCVTPCEIKVPVGDDVAHEIRIKKEGYVDVVQNWRPKHVGEPLPPLPEMRKF